MTLNEYQTEVLRNTGRENLIQWYEEHPECADTLVPKTPLAQGFLHQMGGIEPTATIINCLASGDQDMAYHLLSDLRNQVAQSSRGTAKDALPMLQAFGLIKELMTGDLSMPEDLDPDQTLTQLHQMYYEASLGYKQEQHPGEAIDIVPMPFPWPPQVITSIPDITTNIIPKLIKKG